MTRTVAIALVALAGVAAAGEPIGWERLFSASGGPTLHARARYRDGGGREHRLELWRSDKTLRRDTDDALSLIVERRAGGDDEYHVVQKGAGGQGRAYDVSRQQLYRIGSFPEWVELATLLKRPRGDVRVTAAGSDVKLAAGSCRWYEAATDQARERICWSRALKLPLAVERWQSGAWTPAVTIDEVSVERRIAVAVFHPRVDVAHVDVDRDLD